MLQFVLQKLARLLAVLTGVLLITFLLMHAVPGNPWNNFSPSARAMTNVDINTSMQRELNRRFGLDLPLWRQFTRYVIGDWDEKGAFFCGAVCGNLGLSTSQRGRSVQDVLFAPPEGRGFWESRFGYSLRLVLFGGAIVVGLGIPLGLLSALRPNSRLSRFISIGLAGLISVPNFILGLLAMIGLASWLKIIKVLPDWHNPGDWVVPALVLAVMPLAALARITRATVLNTLGEAYVRTARAKGASQARVMLVHVLRNALVPVITFLGPLVIEMFAGMLVVENLYGFPGFGRQFWDSILKLDYPMILGLVLIYATGIVLVNLLIEMVCEVLDPRIRANKQPGSLG